MFSLTKEKSKGLSSILSTSLNIIITYHEKLKKKNN